MTKILVPNKAMYMFLTGGVGSRKTFTTKAIFEAMIWFYNKHLNSDPLKQKGIVVASIGKATFNTASTTAHSIFHLPCNSSKMLPLDSNIPDMLRKKFDQLQILLIDEVSLIGSKMLYNIDRRLHQIKYTPKIPFGNIDIVFCGDFYQAQTICDAWIFKEPTIEKEKIPYTFWIDNVKFFELRNVIRQTNQHFIYVLNRARTTQKTREEISYLNVMCYKTPPNDPQFPYLFHINSTVDEHNRKMLDYLPTNLFILEAVEKQDTTIDSMQIEPDK